MKTVRRGNKYVITGMDEVEGSTESDPYDTRAEAEADRIGMERTDANANNPRFFTCDPAKWKKQRSKKTRDGA